MRTTWRSEYSGIADTVALVADTRCRRVLFGQQRMCRIHADGLAEFHEDHGTCTIVGPDADTRRLHEIGRGAGTGLTGSTPVPTSAPRSAIRRITAECSGTSRLGG